HSRRGRAGSTGYAHSARHRGGLLFGDFSLGRTRESHRRPDVTRTTYCLFSCSCCSIFAAGDGNCASRPSPFPLPQGEREACYRASSVTPFRASSAISPSLYPASRSTCAECSPSRPDGATLSGLDSDQSVGVRGTRNRPSVGCSSVEKKPLATR